MSSVYWCLLVSMGVKGSLTVSTVSKREFFVPNLDQKLPGTWQNFVVPQIWQTHEFT